jgi:hypothetical protein
MVSQDILAHPIGMEPQRDEARGGKYESTVEFTNAMPTLLQLPKISNPPKYLPSHLRMKPEMLEIESVVLSIPKMEWNSICEVGNNNRCPSP